MPTLPPSPKTASPVPVEGASGQVDKITQWLQNLEALVQLSIIDRDLTSPPGSPAEGDAYIPAATATGDWVGDEGTVQVYYNGWRTLTPQTGWKAWIVDEGVEAEYNGSAWSASAVPSLTIKAITNSDSPYTQLATDDYIEADASSGEITINLLAASARTGMTLTIAKTDSGANKIIIDADGAETINGSLTAELASEDDSVDIFSNGTKHRIR